jgi:hypothetical protein
MKFAEPTKLHRKSGIWGTLWSGAGGIRALSYGGAPGAVGISVGDAQAARSTTRSGDYSENVDAGGGSTCAVDRERIRNSAVENVEAGDSAQRLAYEPVAPLGTGIASSDGR